MAAIDFPNSPAINDEFTAGTTVYRWTGTVWEVKQSTLSSSSFSDSNPIMNGSASAGTSGLASRSDHVHPSDTSKASTTDLSTHTSATTSVHGISNTANLVYTNDARLSDARTPIAHASSHGSAGSDPITIAQSQVTNLTTDLSNKVDKTVIDAKGDLLVGSADNTVARQAVGSNGQILMADSSATAGLRYINAQTQKNAIINSNFSVWQRGTSVGGTGKQFSADRFHHYRANNASGITVSRQTTSDTTNLPQIQYCARVQRNSGNTGTDLMLIAQDVESASSRHFAGQPITISFWARAGANFSSASSALTCEVITGTGTDNSIFSGYSGAAAPIAQVSTLTTTWQRFSYTATFSASLTQVGVVFYYTPVGTAGANDYFEITGVQLEVSPVATPFEFEPYETTLRKCQRYYYRATAGGPFTSFAFLTCRGGNTHDGFVTLPTTMRSVPSSVEYSTLLCSSYAGGPNSAVSSITLNQASQDYAGITVSTGTLGSPTDTIQLIANANSSAYIAFSAEL